MKKSKNSITFAAYSTMGLIWIRQHAGGYVSMPGKVAKPVKLSYKTIKGESYDYALAA